MTAKKFMGPSFLNGNGGDFVGGGASAAWSELENQSAAETTRLNRSGTKENQSAAETARLRKQNGPAGGNAGRGSINPPSAYPHTNNGQDPNFQLNLNFQPNLLDNYDVVTYHLKLFIVSLDDLTTGKIADVSKQTIIAESGVSDLTIDKLEVASIPTPSVESGAGVSTNFKFEVVEPSGAGLLDKIYYESFALGIYNWHTMPYFLQLEFRGRTSDTSEVDNGSPGAISNLKWIWTLKITDIKAKVSEVGTRYEFTAVSYNDMPQANINSSLQQVIVLENLTDFGSAMNQLADIMNFDQLNKLIATYSIPDNYVFTVDPEIAGYKITPPNSNTNSSRWADYVTFGNKSATFNVGTSIDKIIDALLSNTSEYQMSLNNTTTPGGATNSADFKTSNMKKFWRIATESRPIDFDIRRTDFVKEFTYFIYKYDLGVLGADPAQQASQKSEKISSKERIANYLSRSILRKKYNYIFTGLNDQVYEFDLTLNSAFGVLNSRLGGVYTLAATQDKGVVNQNNANDEAKVTESLRAALALQNNATTANSSSASAAMQDARNQITSADLTIETKERYIRILDHAKSADRMQTINSIRSSGGIDNNGALAGARGRAKSIATPVTENGIQIFDGRFISDVDTSPKTTDRLVSAFQNEAKARLRPLAYYEAVHDQQVGLGIEANSNSGLQKLSSVFSVAMHSNLDGSLQAIRMVIKGDPFWLSPHPVTDGNFQLFNSLKTPEEAINFLKYAHFEKTDSINIYGTDNFILIRFRTPRIFNTDANVADGDSAYSEVETFSGVYKVTNIVSKFEMGRFVHELSCILDPEIRTIDFVKQIEDDAKEKSVPLTVTEFNKKKIIPDTAIKTEKINSNAGAGRGFVNPNNVIPSSPGQGIGTIKSNVPSPSNNIITGLPPTFNDNRA